MSDVNIFSDSDVNILRAMVRDFKSRVQNTRNRPAIELPEGQSPDVYVAHAHSGIPAMTFGAGTGTGTHALSLDNPGSATCAIYRRSSTGLVSIGLNLTVHNYSTTAVEANSWLTVARDKFGDWTTDKGGSSALGSGAEYEDCEDIISAGASETLNWLLANQDSTGTYTNIGAGSSTGTSFTVPSAGGYLVSYAIPIVLSAPMLDTEAVTVQLWQAHATTPALGQAMQSAFRDNTTDVNYEMVRTNLIQCEADDVLSLVLQNLTSASDVSVYGNSSFTVVKVF